LDHGAIAALLNPLFHADVLKKSGAELAERLHINIVEIAAGASEQLI